MVIEKNEKNKKNVQINLESVYDNFSSQYIKALRRKHTISWTKLIWIINQIHFPTK
jgi:hypothetical protein